MATDEVKIVQDLIDNSRLLADDKKLALKRFVMSLSKADLKRVRAHLEQENGLIVQAFSKGVGAVTDENSADLFEGLKWVFKDANKKLRTGQEEESRQTEEKELESLFNELP